MPDALSFLQSVAGAAQPVRDRPAIRLATIDPAYDRLTYPATLPLVTFEGESSLSGKRYVALQPYRPEPGDRVVMVPVGHTYVIFGAVDSAAGTVITQTGTVSFSFTSVTDDTRQVTFPIPFLAAPVVMANINTPSGVAAQWKERAVNITATDCTIMVFHTSPSTWSNIPVAWTATGRVAG